MKGESGEARKTSRWGQAFQYRMTAEEVVRGAASYGVSVATYLYRCWANEAAEGSADRGLDCWPGGAVFRDWEQEVFSEVFVQFARKRAVRSDDDDLWIPALTADSLRDALRSLEYLRMCQRAEGGITLHWEKNLVTLVHMQAIDQNLSEVVAKLIAEVFGD